MNEIQNVQQQSAQPKPSSLVTALSILVLVFGIISVLGSLIPCLGMLAVYISIPTVIVAIVTIIIAKKKNEAFGLAIAGLVIAAIATVIAIAQIQATESAVNELDNWSKEMDRELDNRAKEWAKDWAKELDAMEW